jgi:amino acid transporter
MTKLERSIGLVALTLYGVGDILGAGIYGLVGKAAGMMGNGLWLAFVCSFCVALLTGLSYAALCSRYPKAAGSSYVVLKAFNSGFLSFVVGLAALFAGITSMATASRIFGGYLSGLVPAIPVGAGAFLFLSLVGVIVWKGVRESILVNSVLTLTESLGLLLVIGVGAAYLGSADYLDFSAPGNGGGLQMPVLLSTSVLVFYSFVGFEDLINMGEEVKNPHSTLPRALLFSLLIASAIYLLVAVIAVSVIPAAELAQSNQPLVDVVRKAAPWFPPQAFSVISLLAVCNTALLNFLMGSRLIYGLAHLRVLPSFLDQVNPKTKTPTRAVVLVYAITLLLAVSGDVSTLARATSLLLLLVFVSMNLSLIRIKWKGRRKHEHFDVPMIVPALGTIACVALLLNGNGGDWLTAGGLIALILALYGITRPKYEVISRMVDE